jgi:serine protease AprX
MKHSTQRRWHAVTGSATAFALLTTVVVAAPAAAARQGAASAVVTPTVSTDYGFPATGATLADLRRITRADTAHANGWTGKGVGIALIDTGVVPVDGLTAGNVVNGPDLSLESQVPSLTRRDTYGHGTHLAGIMVGRNADRSIIGIAPDAKLTSIKVGMANGAVDVTQMLAAIDWVVEHRNDDPANPIKVLNLSYGTDSVLTETVNPLSLAVQNAHKAGIVVVVAAGNTGNTMTSPAYDPFMFTVGATDMKGTTNPADDVVAAFSSKTAGNGRRPDIYAPGTSIVSLRNPGSFVDANYPSARVGEKFFKGSGTSQAAAVVSAAAALYLQKNRTSPPDSTKCTILNETVKLKDPTLTKGALDIFDAISNGWGCVVTGGRSNGSGSIQAARGSGVVTVNGSALTGERDIFGPFDVKKWAAASTAGTSWSGGNWMGRAWTGTGYTSTANGQADWTGRAWSGRAWSGRAWSDLTWSAALWTGRAWSSTTVKGITWAGTGWSSASWLSGDKRWMY